MAYTPGSVFSTIDPELAVMILQELHEIAAAFLTVENILLEELHAEPSKPRNGMIVLADGTDWNPISGGAGYYGRSAGAWVKLG